MNKIIFNSITYMHSSHDASMHVKEWLVPVQYGADIIQFQSLFSIEWYFGPYLLP